MQPHIIFPKYSALTVPARRTPFPKLQTPSIQQKAKWITACLDELLNQGKLSTQPGFWPERTLVFETMDSIDNFYTVAKKIPKFNLLFSELGEELEPDNDYYFLKDKNGEKDNKKIQTYLYFSMVNRQSLDRIYACWKAYEKDNEIKFGPGLAGLKDIFKQLRSVRFWDTEDRLNVLGLKEDLLSRVENEEEFIPIEIELWFHPSSRDRRHLEDKVRESIKKIEGSVLKSCVIQEIEYHSLLASISNKSIKDLLAGDFDNIELVRCDSVFVFRPVGQCNVSPVYGDEKVEMQHDEEKEEKLVQHDIEPAPIVALLDGYPIAKHQSLKDKIIIDDPLEFGGLYLEGENVHGTSMASLILHGDKSEDDVPLSRRILVCPVMAPDKLDTFHKIRQEKIPEDYLPIDLVHTTVRRILVGTKENPPIAPNVKIINISIGDRHRLFDNRISPWARLLDWLSYSLNVLFVVSAGNYPDQIQLDISTAEFKKLPADQKEHLVLKALQKEASMKRLRSPAEAINVLTVGALHQDGFQGDIIGEQINPFTTKGMPSPVNPIAWGKKRSVKPEILLPGGRQMYSNENWFSDKRNVVLKPLNSTRPPGLLTAAPGNTPGALNTYIYSSGTSNATAIATRKLAQLYSTLSDLSFGERGEELDRKSDAVLLKALLCHGAESSDAFGKIEKSIRENTIEKIFKANIARFVGYGAVEIKRLLGCEDNQATLLRSGIIKNGERHRFQLPLPPSLSSKIVPRRLLITLAWFSPVTSQRAYYREARLWFDVVNKSYESLLGLDQRQYDANIVRNGTVQHEIFFSANKAGAFTADNTVEIDVNCAMKHSDVKEKSIIYGLVVTLDSQDRTIPIYREIKDGINKFVAERSRIQQVDRAAKSNVEIDSIK